MLSKFVQDTKASEFRRWLTKIDLSNAEVLTVEKQVYEALVLGLQQKHWSPSPIAPLAEPTNLQELVGDHFNGARDELLFQAQRLDNLYQWLNNTNNLLKSEMESVEGIVTRASDDIQDISVITGQTTQSYYWVSDTFNSTTFVDQKATTAMVDTDHGMVLLSPVNMTDVKNYQPVLNSEQTVGLPGCNLLIIDRGDPGGPDKEPTPNLEGAKTTDFAAVFDSDSSTWFEVERNFIAPKQKCTKFGRAYVTNPAGQEVDVMAVTSDLDWRAYVQWFNKSAPDTGVDNKGVLMAEFKDLNTTNGILNSPSTVTAISSDAAHLAFDLVFFAPRPLSFISLTPFVRGGQPVRIKSLKAFAGDQEFVIAKDVDLSATSTSTTLLNQEIFRRTGAQNTGGMYAIPTNKDITRIEIRLASNPEKAPMGMAHPFQEKYEETRREQRVIFFSIVSHDYEWIRIPANEQPRQITSSYSGPKLLGSIPSSLDQVLFAANDVNRRLLEAQTIAKQTGQDLSAVLQSLGLAKEAAGLLKGTGAVTGALGAGLGALGTAIGVAATVAGGVLAVGTLIDTLFGYHKDVIVHEVRKGYDIFAGYRAAVGLRDMKLLQIDFTASSVLQSTKLQFQGPVKRIGLFVDDKIPEDWGVGTWMTYFVSVDGTNWSPLPKVTDVSIDKGFEPPTPTDFVYFRAVMNGNPEDPSSSPQLRHYVLQGVPA